MITWITPQIAIGELSDILYNSIEDLQKIGFTSVISILMKDDERLRKKFREAWNKGILIRQHFIQVGSESMVEDLTGENLKRFVSQLNLAYYKLDSIFYADYQEKVLVHCVAGMDRSPFVVARYLVEKKRIMPRLTDKKMEFVSVRTMSEAYAFIKKKRPQIIEHPEWVWWEE